MSYPDSSPGAEDLQPGRERRRHNLQRLVTVHGGVHGLSRWLDMSSLVIANYLKPWDGQIAGIRGTIDDTLARRLETGCELPLGGSIATTTGCRAAHAWPHVAGYESLRHFELWLPD